MASDGKPTRILILNPNSSPEMTKGMVAAAQQVSPLSGAQISGYTGPADSPGSINNGKDIEDSTQAVLSDLARGSVKLDDYDAALVACFSVHTLVTKLGDMSPLPITGIFEASITTAQLLLRPHSSEKWGIVTTGKFWEEHLTTGVKSFLGQDEGTANQKFAGVFSTGLNAGDFHTVPPEEVDARLRKASRKLFECGDVKCVVMGCGGMAGLESIIRSTATDVLGPEEGKKVYVVDGVKAGVLQLEETIRGKKTFGS